jgi:NADPH2:quinone reductase
MMEAIQFSRTGGPEVLETVKRSIPEPGPGEVLVKAHAIGVAYFDMLIRSGRYPWMPDLPYVPGNEMSGYVVDGNGSSLKKGQPVYLANWDNGYKGGFYADYLVAAATAARPLPVDADLNRAAALSNYVVAACLLDYAAPIVKDRTVVIHGAAGGVGTALIELGRLAGAHVVGIVGSEDKCALVRSLGATAIRRDSASVVDAVMTATGGHGADLVCNHLAGNSFASDLKMVAPFGTIVSYGALGGLPEQDLFRDMRANLNRCPALRCFTMHVFDDMPDWRDRCTMKVLQLFAENKIAPVLGRVLPLADAAYAHRLLEQRAVIGKILLKPNSANNNISR